MKSKAIVVAVVLLSSVALWAGYTKWERTHLGVVSSGGLCFALGGGWQQDRNTPESGLYPARFVSQSGVVRVILLPPELGDLQTAAAGLLQTFHVDPRSVRDSFVREPFIAESGLSGIHVSFRRLAEEKGRLVETECHDYLVRNHAGRFVAVNYQASAHGDTVTMDRTIRNTLRFQ